MAGAASRSSDRAAVSAGGPERPAGGGAVAFAEAPVRRAGASSSFFVVVLRGGLAFLRVAVAEASYLFLVHLHCGHCRALLPPIGTVGNGRVGPGGAGLFIARLVKQRASPLPPTVTSFAPPADAWRRFRRVPRARAARRRAVRSDIPAASAAWAVHAPAARARIRAVSLRWFLGMAAFGRIWPLFGRFLPAWAVWDVWEGRSAWPVLAAFRPFLAGSCGAAPRGRAPAGPPLARPARSSSSSRYFWLRLAGVARFWGFGRFGQNGGLVRNAQFRLELSERFDLGLAPNQRVKTARKTTGARRLSPNFSRLLAWPAPLADRLATDESHYIYSQLQCQDQWSSAVKRGESNYFYFRFLGLLDRRHSVSAARRESFSRLPEGRNARAAARGK